MQVKSKSGRFFDLPSDKQDANIKKGIANDPDTYEISIEEVKTIRYGSSDNGVATEIFMDEEKLKARDAERDIGRELLKAADEVAAFVKEDRTKNRVSRAVFDAALDEAPDLPDEFDTVK